MGGVMAASPRRIWWVTESWKFRNPEANEPSDTAYGMTRAGGVFVILLALFLGASIIHSDLQRQNRREAEEQRKAAEAAFVVPPPEDRGGLPVVGYFADPTPGGMRVYVYYLAPGGAVHQYIRTMSDKFSYPCYTSASVTKAGGDRMSANPELYWAPKKIGDMSRSDMCRPGTGLVVHGVSLDDVTAETTIVTDSAIVDRDGAEIMPAAPGNVVPKLVEGLRTAS
ncbi:DUF6199 family natural product biosynthesis protein [Mycolicibacterium lutetiense]|uniref:DUF6199 domain-containing protein n=1 Tax=Mycolicibacterium lutetiense TaxID=1641992 RepID=A0ABS4ZW22_9MYCO|nr:DUF6199 family natural product biosynthesis protein [Mycolicibacterium lutetiense]MBP2453703.1 hypothetical protein [Mycolicibacterium lutetiense]